MDDPVIQVSCQEPSMSSKYNHHEGPPILDTLIIKISTQNFQGIFLRGGQGHSGHQEWPCPPSLLSGTLNVHQVLPWRTPHSWHTSNKNINTKHSGYLPWGQQRSTMTTRMTLSPKYPFKNPQDPTSTPIKDPNSWHTYNKDINLT